MCIVIEKETTHIKPCPIMAISMTMVEKLLAEKNYETGKLLNMPPV